MLDLHTRLDDCSPVRGRIAIASSGLGHVNRGVESWAADTAAALRRAGVRVALFQGGGTSQRPWQHSLACLRRHDAATGTIVAMGKRLGGWRYGVGSTYELEQVTFAISLWSRIYKDFDIVHVQDPLVATLFTRLRQCQLSRAIPILAHGTEEANAYLRRFAVLQHLAPCYLTAWAAQQPLHQQCFAIPNFVDTTLFSPGDRAEARADWSLPQDALVILCVAALKRHHKRCDYLIRECATFKDVYRRDTILVLAGAREDETPDVVRMGRAVLGDSLVVYEALDRTLLPSLYRAADIFALASLHEMMPIAALEALACGLPVTCCSTAVLNWIVGDAGAPEDLSREGGLVRQWCRLLEPEHRSRAAAAARSRAQSLFSEAVVVRDIIAMYNAILAG